VKEIEMMPACTPMVDRFQALTDLRSSIHLTYTLPEVLFIVYASILSGYNEWEGMASFARYNLPWFRQFFPYRWGMPSHHTIEKICMMIDPKAFMQLFVDWMGDAVEQINAQKDDSEKITDDIIAVDGKALRGSRPAKGKKMVHIVSAYSTKLSLILGLTPVERKSNEITAIPELLDMLVIEGCLITSDAMGCQKAICQKIVDKKADYLICAKGNQPILCEHIERVFEQHMSDHPEDPEPSEDTTSFAETEEQNRGRQEHRRCWVFGGDDTIAAVDPDGEWPKLTQIAVIQRDRRVGSKQSTELHCYIMSRELSARSVLEGVRNHWCIENKQHLRLDISFAEDASKIHERNAVKNVATVRRCCQNAHDLSDRFADKSMKRRIELAGLDDDYRTELVREHSFF
jgi:predicted transposase YbfD/YdcC